MVVTKTDQCRENPGGLCPKVSAIWRVHCIYVLNGVMIAKAISIPVSVVLIAHSKKYIKQVQKATKKLRAGFVQAEMLWGVAQCMGVVSKLGSQS